MKVADIFSLGGRTFGYCSCGREVEMGKHKRCPYCDNKLVWNGERSDSNDDSVEGMNKCS